MPTILETSDAQAGVQTSYQLQIGDRFLGKMGGSDVDWLRIDLVAGQVVTFAVVGLGGPGLAVADPKMWLRNANGALIQAEDDFGPGLMPMLTHTADRTGAHFISVRALDAGTDYGVVVVAGDRLRLDADFAAGMLYREGASWAATPGEPVTLTWSFRDTGPAQDANGRSATFSRLSEAQQAAMAEALQAYAAVCGVSFSQVAPGGFSNQATLRFGAYSSSSDGSGAYAYLPGSTAASANAGDLWLNRTSVGDDFAPGSYGRYVLLHELGHSMGLAHPGDYNAGASSRPITYETDAQYVEDSGQYTVMSYFDAVKTEGAAPPVHAQTLMMHDIRALQVMYGTNQSHNAGATVYGFGATEAGSVYDFAVNRTPLLCIWDGGGRDMLDVSGFGGRQKIDLQAGHFSDIGGFKGNVSIALDCVIEDATGGRGADLILGNAAGNRLFGRGGADTIEGGAGADTLFGGAGADVLTGGTGRDTFVFGAGHGEDRITDMDVLRDILRLGTDLWGGLSKTAAEVLDDFARSEDGHVVLDFGVDELHLMNLTSEAGLSGRIVLI